MRGTLSEGQVLGQLRNNIPVRVHRAHRCGDVVVSHLGAVDGREMNLRQRMSVRLPQSRRRRRRRRWMLHIHDPVLEEVTGLSRRQNNLVIMESSGYRKNSIERHLNKKERETTKDI